jgi:hypothetical protein
MSCNKGGRLDLAGAIRLAAADPGGEAQLRVDVPRRDGVRGRLAAGIPSHLPAIPADSRHSRRFQAFPPKSEAFHALARWRPRGRLAATPAPCSVEEKEISVLSNVKS